MVFSNKTILKVVTILCFLTFVNTSFGQKTKIYTDKYVDFRDAQDLYDKEKFSAAQDKFLNVLNSISDKQDEVRVNSEYYYAVCALELFHPDAEYLLSRFVVEHPENAKAESVYFQLGRQKYRLKRFKSVIEYFEKVDKFKLEKHEKTEFEFKLGYSYFRTKKKAEAKPHFAAIKDDSSSYQVPAMYYFSHIAYENGDNQTALNGFKSISETPMFQHIVPYYVAQIYHKQEKYDKLIDYAPKYYENISKKEKQNLQNLSEMAITTRKTIKKLFLI